jgi:predicted CXXCH cytochrome family protein
MRILSLLVFFVLLSFFNPKSDSPHGADFKVSCKTCHSPKGWQVDKAIYSFNHSKTRFSLTGQHSIVSCRQCHPTLIFTAAKSECNECHNDVHEATAGLDCARCHTPVSWLVNDINGVHQMSRFPLLGPHRTADCSDCHKSSTLVRFDVPGIDCIDCHRNNYLATTNPNHVQSGMSEDCSICHKVNSFEWASGGFNHDYFPLVQGHSAVKCTDCHTSGTFSALNADCYSCHQTDFLATVSPNHSASNFPTACSNCHTLSTGWKPAAFDHSSFPLTQGHSIPKCIDCHIGGNYTSLPTDCYSCHQQDFLTTTNPNHQASAFSTACLTCHTTNAGWKPTTFNHNSFPLTLGHSTPDCIDCHIGGNYTSISADCYSCHKPNFQATTNPNHIAAGFATVCLTCHTTNPGWKPATFNHGSFPLTLGHSTAACADCHVGGNYTSTPTDCYSCHQQNYTATTNPNHVSAGFPQTCQTCHTTNPGWKPASFNHSSFPLTLGHSTPACTDCHIGGNYTSTPTDCYSCHLTDYNNSVNPNHRTLSFSTTCTQCHTTNPDWKPASYTQHDSQSFPIYSGRHKGQWSECTECHTDPSNYTLFNCKTCHSGVHTGQNYSNAQCYSCHPKGVAD